MYILLRESVKGNWWEWTKESNLHVIEIVENLV